MSEQQGMPQISFASFLPQGTVIRSLIKSLEDHSYVHAYLITGGEGYGKRTLAGLIASYLLCTGKRKPCGICPACVQVKAGTHPDCLRIRPGRKISSDEATETGKNIIQVATIREVIQRVNVHAYEGTGKVVLIEEAGKMNPQAQNALLKTLEEPPEDTVFLLLTDAPGILLPTVISRCRQLALHAWPDPVIASELQRRGIPRERADMTVRLCEGSIGRAIRMSEDEAYWQYRQMVLERFLGCPDRSTAFALAAEWKEKRNEAEPLFNQLDDLIRTMMMVHFSQADPQAMDDYPGEWKTGVEKMDDHALVHLLDAVSEAKNAWQRQVNWQAVLERLMLRIMEEKAKWQL